MTSVLERGEEKPHDSADSVQSDATTPVISKGDVLLEVNGTPCLDASYDDIILALHATR
jgi:hypothetical protein